MVHNATPAAENLIELEERYGARNYKPLDVVLHRGEGVWVWDVDGNRYLDCLSAYSAVNQGHCHPKILAAMESQARRLTLTSRAFRNDQLGPFYRELCELTNSHKVLPMNSGAEAVESAIKVVRKWGYDQRGIPPNRAEIVVCDRNFHGRTIAIVGFSSDPESSGGFGPFPGGFVSVPYGDTAAVERAVTERTVAILAEPIQGEAGVIIPPAGYLRDLRRICDDHGIQLILDEIQTGLGRTGKLLAEEHERVEADLTVVGKALSGGFYPISAVLSNTEVMDVLGPGQHGSTFGGNPLAAAIGRAAIRVLVEEGMIENARSMGERFLSGLREVADRSGELIREVRGRGLLLALELEAQAGGARRYTEALKERGVLVKETHTHTIRIAPPLVIDAPTVDWALEQISAVLEESRVTRLA